MCFGFPFIQWAWACHNTEIHSHHLWIGDYKWVLSHRGGTVAEQSYRTKMDKINTLPRKYQP